MSRVFVIQHQHRWNRTRERFEPKFDLSPAEEFGELVMLLSPTAAPFRSEEVQHELCEKLADFGDEDFLLLVGNPALIGMTVAIAATVNGGAVRLLQWNGRERRYIPITIRNLTRGFKAA